MADHVTAGEFTRNFPHYRDLAARQAVAVTSDGTLAGYFVSPGEYEEFRRYKQRRSSFATTDLPDAIFEAIVASRMDPRHDHLDALLDEDRGP